MKQKNKVIRDISISTITELFVHFFVHLLCTFCALSPSFISALFPVKKLSLQ